MTDRNVERGWLEIAEEIVPENASMSQYLDTRRAFYYGVMLMFDMVCTIADTTDEASSEHHKLMQGIHRELNRFAAQQMMDAPVAGSA